MEWPKITKDTPLEEIKAIHQRIWDYVIEYGEKPHTPYFYDCVACHYDFLASNMCLECPIAWPGDVECGSMKNTYTKWRLEKDLEKKTALAKQIRDMPFKYESKS